MYESYFAFKRAPFSIAPDPSFLYPGPQHKKGLEQLNYGLNKEGGFIVLTGEVGTGKTTLSRLFLSQIANSIQVASVFNAKLSSSDLLSNIAAELKIDIPPTANDFDKTQAITQRLQHNHQDTRKTLLVIEEAQNLSADALETLRLLTNIETDTEKLIHILLIGQPELVTTLNRPDLRQLNQRVIARFHLRPLSQEETENYLIHRLTVAGGQQSVFKRNAINALYQLSNGIPRIINLLADRALQLAFEQNKKYASHAEVEQANALINGHLPETPKAKQHPTPWIMAALATSIALLLILIIAWPKTETRKPEEPAASSLVPAQPALSTTEPITPQPLAEIITQPKEDASTSAQPISTNQQLLQLWRISADTVAEPCNIAEANDLACFNTSRLSLADLLQLNRPALITLFNHSGLAQDALIEQYDGEHVTVYTEQQRIRYTVDELAQRWRGDATIVWQPAPGWIDSVRVGDRSVQVVHWLQSSLNSLGRVDGKIITGGYYTELLSNEVAKLQAEAGLEADGILGRKTVIAINTALANVPTLTATAP